MPPRGWRAVVVAACGGARVADAWSTIAPLTAGVGLDRRYTYRLGVDFCDHVLPHLREDRFLTLRALERNAVNRFGRFRPHAGI